LTKISLHKTYQKKLKEQQMLMMNENPLLWEARVGKWKAIPFDKLKNEHFMPTIEWGLKKAKEAVKAIKENNDKPTFENTILALENSSEMLEEATNIFYNLMNCESDDEFKKLAQEIGPMLSQFHNELYTDEILFEKVKNVYQNPKDLNQEEARLLETNYKSFARNGALLNDSAKKRMQEIDMELSQLSPTFSHNVLSSTNAFSLHITDKEELEGLPESALQAAAHLAQQKGYKEGWLFNLQFPSIQPILTYAKNRELRKKISIAYGSRAFRDKFDNQEILKKIAQLRYERAQILGYNTVADYVLEERMAKSPQTVTDFIENLYDVAMPFAKKELEEIKQIAQEDGIDELQSYDFGYYTNLYKKAKFNFDEEELKPYFQMENVIAGVFAIAEKLYDLHFQELKDIPVYHKDVTVYEVTDKSGNDVGLLYIDLFPRDTKRGGAWMTTYLSQGFHHGKILRPHVSIVASLTPSTDKMPSLLRLDEVKTIFHEFGHALHALLSDCAFTSLASPNVYWDFVELPSQIMENWAQEKEGLDVFAKHYQTHEPIPADMVEKIKKIQNFQTGFQTIRQLSYCLLDMAWHAVNPNEIKDAAEYEAKVLKKTRMFPENPHTNLSTAFSHIFAGGYAAGYYSYKWAEVLEADAFELFLQKGIFDKETANSFKNNILAKGNTEHPMNLFVKFRGHEPDPDALLRKAGLK
jgi:Zn-dependent oligopeptidase